VGLETDDMWTAERLSEIRTMSRKLSEIDGVYDVLSFTDVPDPKPGPAGLEVRPLVPQVPTDATELQALKQHVLQNENARGNLVSPDGKAAMILCFLGGKRSAMDVATDIKSLALESWHGQGVFFGGAPFIRQYVAGGTKHDLRQLTPVVAIVVLLVTFLIFRNLAGVLLSLGLVGVAIVWTMGLIALRGRGLTVVSSSLPTLLLAIGGAYGIQILSAYFSGCATTVKGRIVEAMREVGPPVIASALATVAGFMSFLVMDVAPLRSFGLEAATGVAFTALLTLCVIPAALSFSHKVPATLSAARLARPLGKLGGFAASHRRATLVAAIIVAAMSLLGIRRLAPDATLKTFFAKGSEPDQANAFLERHFGGSIYLQIYFEGDMRCPFVLAELRKIVEYVRGRNDVVQVSSIIDPLVMMSEAMGGRPDLPLNRERTQSLYPFLLGTAAIDQILSPEMDAALVQVRLGEQDPSKVARVVADIRAFIDAEVPRAVDAVEIATLDAEEAERAKQKVRQAVARRLGRLARVYASVPFSEEGANKALAVLEEGSRTTDLVEGDDLTAAVDRAVREQLCSDSSALEEPPEQADQKLLSQWDARCDWALAAALPPSRLRQGKEAIAAAVRGALPAIEKHDSEGLQLASEALASQIEEAVTAVRAERLAVPSLAALSVRQPSAKLRKLAMGAITDLDAPAFGFPSQASSSKRVMATVTGQPVINVAFGQSSIRNQVRSMLAAMFVLLLVMTVTFRSPLIALKALTPPLFMLTIAGGLMGAFDIPIDLTTSMISSIALGIGVDYSIAFLWRRRHRGESLARTSEIVGPGIASNALQVGAGFAVLALSNIVVMQRFGAFVAVTMVMSAVATFLLLPALRAEGALPVGQEDEDESAAPQTDAPR
jgi:predicted RND superfamily exporter protein